MAISKKPKSLQDKIKAVPLFTGTYARDLYQLNPHMYISMIKWVNLYLNTNPKFIPPGVFDFCEYYNEIKSLPITKPTNSVNNSPVVLGCIGQVNPDDLPPWDLN